MVDIKENYKWDLGRERLKDQMKHCFGPLSRSTLVWENKSEEQHIRYLYRDSIGSIGMRGKKSAVITSDFFHSPLILQECRVRDPCCQPNDCRLKKSSQCSDAQNKCCRKCQVRDNLGSLTFIAISPLLQEEVAQDNAWNEDFIRKWSIDIKSERQHQKYLN